MNPNPDAIWLMFLSPIGVLATAYFVIWLIKREDQAAERKRDRLPPRETGKPV